MNEIFSSFSQTASLLHGGFLVHCADVCIQQNYSQFSCPIKDKPKQSTQIQYTEKFILFLILSVIIFQLYLAIIAHQQPIASSTNTHIHLNFLSDTKQDSPDSLESLHQKLNIQPIKYQPKSHSRHKKKDSPNLVIPEPKQELERQHLPPGLSKLIQESHANQHQQSPSEDDTVRDRAKHRQERKKLMAKYRGDASARSGRQDRKFRKIRRDSSSDSTLDERRQQSIQKREEKLERIRHRRHRSRMRNPFKDPDDKIMEDRLEFEKANLKQYMENGGWIDIENIPKDSLLYRERTKELNITEKLLSGDMVNNMYKYDGEKDKLLNDKWSVDDIELLMKNKQKLYDKYGIIMTLDGNKNSYDLQLLEYDILKWIIAQQYVKECPTEYFEIAVLEECGFGCKLDDYILICAKYAISKGYLFEFKNWGNDNDTLHEYGEWNTFFKPLSNILEICKESELKELKDGMFQERPRMIGFWIPEIFEDRLNKLHNDSVLFFHGVLNRYLLRLNMKYRKQYELVRRTLTGRDDLNKPIIGVHVRRTDKIMESNVYEWKNYIDLMRYLLEYNGYNVDDGFYVFLATDDKEIVKTAIVEDKNDELKIEFIWNKYSIDIDDGIELKQRRTNNGLRSIVFDILLLSECDYFLGQDGSRVSRLVLELFAMRFPDYKQRMISLDAVNNNLLDFPYWISQNWLH